MESSALFVLSSIYRTRAGGAMLVVNESELAEFDDTEASKHMNEFDADSVIRVGVEAIKILIAHDKQK
jgi:uridine phosphorylase